jgi:hypothetical protein
MVGGFFGMVDAVLEVMAEASPLLLRQAGGCLDEVGYQAAKAACLRRID